MTSACRFTLFCVNLAAFFNDLTGIAEALTLESELSLTTDGRQAQLAKAEGLKVASVG